LNEYELVKAVQGMGYECVLLPLESMTLYEQMAQLRSLDVLIGIHGSGLDNAVFLHKGAVLVQLLPYSVQHKCTFRSSAERAGS
jgi:capsular polysaccharide biosynthesis protein